MLLRGLLFRGAAPDFSRHVSWMQGWRIPRVSGCKPLRTPHHAGMLRFSLFGFPVTVHWMFWVALAILGGGLRANGPQAFQFLLLWVLAGFVSILIHELGHTFMQRRFGARAQIMLYAFGGLAIPDRSFTRKQDIIVSLAGPVVQIVIGLAVGELVRHSTGDAWQILAFLHSFYTVSIFWGLLNLVPIFPLDGGHVLLNTLGPRNEKLSYLIGVACAAALALYMLLVWKSIWNTVFFGALAWQNFQRSQGQTPPPFMRP